ncbi:MAG: hypothetical protein CL685_00750 [Candidatus Magasanikbacteria bacterium]|nr:hypothetical protein [Candidatus Magasanikbacteria bacterium]
MTDIKQRWNQATSNFSNNRYVSGSKEFLASNTLAAKLVFLILVIIGFIIVLRLGVSLLAWLFAPPRSPKLVSCVKDAKKFLKIPQNPNVHGSKPIMRSVDQRGGLEFTWTVWLYIDDLEYKNGQRKHIFHKGNDRLDANQTAYPNNAPGMYLHPTRNTIIIVMNTFDKILEEVEINDIPLHKWICVAVRLRGKVMDVYVNGDIVLRHVFKAVPRQNYGDVYVNMNGGYSGQLADLWYHDYSLSGVEIQKIVTSGPCLRLQNQRGPALPPYLSMAWYFQNDQAPLPPAGAHWPTLTS